MLLVLLRRIGKEHLLLTHPLRLVAHLPTALCISPLADRDLWQPNILHDGPDDGQTRRLGREGINLIGALPHEASQAFNRIGAANVAMHDRREGIKRQHMLFIDASAADGFGIALLVFGECSRPN